MSGQCQARPNHERPAAAVADVRTECLSLRQPVKVLSNDLDVAKNTHRTGTVPTQLNGALVLEGCPKALAQLVRVDGAPWRVDTCPPTLLAVSVDCEADPSFVLRSNELLGCREQQSAGKPHRLLRYQQQAPGREDEWLCLLRPHDVSLAEPTHRSAIDRAGVDRPISRTHNRGGAAHNGVGEGAKVPPNVAAKDAGTRDDN